MPTFRIFIQNHFPVGLFQVSCIGDPVSEEGIPCDVRQDDHEHKEYNKPFVQTGVANSASFMDTLVAMGIPAYPTGICSDLILMVNTGGLCHE